MKVRTAPELTFHQKLFGVLLKDQTAFMRWFWKEDLSLPASTRQKLFWNDLSKQVVCATGRKTFKTGKIEAEIFRYALNYRGEQAIECAMGTPGDNQRRFIWDRVTQKIERAPLFKLLFKYSKNEGKLESPRVTWYFRIDGSDGTDKNWVGLRLKKIIFDEAAFTNHVCHDSRRQSALPDCEWGYYGVPNGMRGTPFYELDQGEEGKRWSRHKISTFANPLYWHEEMRDKLKVDYSKSPQGYVTQVMGAWGDEVFSSFPPDSLAIDDRMPYRVVHLRGDDIPSKFDMVYISELVRRLTLPKVRNIYRYVIGGDIGVFQDPSEFIVAYCTKPPEVKKDAQGEILEVVKDSDWRLLCRVNLMRAHTQAQTRLIRTLVWILGEAKLAKIAIDKMGPGTSILTELLELDGYPQEYWAKRVIAFEAGGTIEVTPKKIDLDNLDTGPKAYDWRPNNRQEKKGQKVRQKEWYTRQLQAALVSAKNDLTAPLRLWLGSDEEMLEELIGTRERKTEAGYTVYIPPTEGTARLPIDHRLDAARCVVSAILNYLDDPEDDPEEEVGDMVAWSDEPLFGRGAVTPPWARQPMAVSGIPDSITRR